MKRLPYFALAVACACAHPPAPAVAPLPARPGNPDSAKYALVDSAAYAFLDEWREAWQETELDLPQPASPRETALRADALHCHFAETPPDIRGHVIVGSVAAHASCPTWYPATARPVADERLQLDDAITSTRRLRVRMLRERLRATLDATARTQPRDVHLTRQRLRFALDAGAFGDAWYVAEHCDIGVAECGLLRGLVLYRIGRVAEADSTFLEASELMPDSARCAWNDVGALLDADTRKSYAAMPCAARARFEDALWWLADPLYSEPGNERRAEHFARRTLITLHADLGADARESWASVFGGDALRETLLRYGWPAHFAWGGKAPDVEHSEWLNQHGARAAPPYATREYSRGRLHVLPAGGAVLSPFDAPADDWQLSAPSSVDDWWPIEHFARDRGTIVQLPVGQLALLRRQDSTRLLWAADPDTAMVRPLPLEPLEGHVFQGREVGEARQAGTFAWSAAEPMLADAMVASGPSVIGIEVAGDSTRPAARTRFGTRVPQPLSTLRRGHDLSQPVLFRAPADASPSLDDQAIARLMYGTTTYSGVGRLGVYWESYGIPPDDSVEIELRIARTDRPGLLTRAVRVFGLGQSGSSEVGIRVREGPGGRAVRRMEGAVPVQMRSVVIDVSRLQRGTYELTLAMNPLRGARVSSTRVFTLR